MYDYYEPEPSYWQYYVILYVIQSVLFCVVANSMMNLIERTSGDLRTISPAQPWLCVIPFFGSGWFFYMVHQMGNMLHEEFSRRKIVEFETSPGLVTGWGFAFTLLVAQLTLLVDIPVFTTFLYIGALVLFILYVVKLSGFRTKLDRDLMNQFQQPIVQPPFQQPPPPQHYQPPFQQPPPTNYSPPTGNIPHSPPADEWDRWRPK